MATNSLALKANCGKWHNVSSLRVQYSAKDSQSGLDHFEYTYDDVKAKKAEEIVLVNVAIFPDPTDIGSLHLPGLFSNI